MAGLTFFGVFVTRSDEFPTPESLLGESLLGESLFGGDVRRRKPTVHVGERSPAIGLFAFGLLDALGEGREQPEIHVHGLEGGGIRALGDVVE